MRKSIGFLLIMFFLAFPFFANAGIIDTPVTLNEGYVSTDSGNFTFPSLGTASVYTNYSATISGQQAGDVIENGTYAAFCVENAWTTGTNNSYTVLSVDSSLSNYGLTALLFEKAAWLAENYYDDDKEAAQIAIWELMFDTGSDIYSGAFKYNSDITAATLANAANYLASAANITFADNFISNWVLAVNPTISATGTVSLASSQNYLVRVSNPVPEPATMLLFGTGLIGLAGFGRKKFGKKYKTN